MSYGPLNHPQRVRVPYLLNPRSTIWQLVQNSLNALYPSTPAVQLLPASLLGCREVPAGAPIILPRGT